MLQSKYSELETAGGSVKCDTFFKIDPKTDSKVWSIRDRKSNIFNICINIKELIFGTVIKG